MSGRCPHSNSNKICDRTITVRYIAADPSNMNANFGLALIAAAGLVGAGLFGGFFEFRRARRISGTHLIQPKE